MNIQEIWKQNEIKRKTKEFLDQQLEEKKQIQNDKMNKRDISPSYILQQAYDRKEILQQEQKSNKVVKKDLRVDEDIQQSIILNIQQKDYLNEQQQLESQKQIVSNQSKIKSENKQTSIVFDNLHLNKEINFEVQVEAQNQKYQNQINFQKINRINSVAKDIQSPRNSIIESDDNEKQRQIYVSRSRDISPRYFTNMKREEFNMNEFLPESSQQQNKQSQSSRNILRDSRRIRYQQNQQQSNNDDQFIKNKRMITDWDQQGLDLNVIQNIIFENQQLKYNLEHKQQIIDLLVKPKPIIRENVRLKALQEIQERDEVNYVLNRQKSVDAVLYSPEIKKEIPNNNERKRRFQMIRENTIKRKLTQPMPPNYSNNNKNESRINYRRKLTYGSLLSQIELNLQNQNDESEQKLNNNNVRVNQQINNYTFANNFVENIRKNEQSQDNPSLSTKLKFHKEFSTNHLLKKFCC